MKQLVMNYSQFLCAVHTAINKKEQQNSRKCITKNHYCDISEPPSKDKAFIMSQLQHSKMGRKQTNVHTCHQPPYKIQIQLFSLRLTGLRGVIFS